MTDQSLIELSEACPARCKKNGRCYGKAYFKGDPGKSKKCDMKCNYIKKCKMLEEVKKEK